MAEMYQNVPQTNIYLQQTINFFHCCYALSSYQDRPDGISIADSKKLNF